MQHNESEVAVGSRQQTRGTTVELWYNMIGNGCWSGTSRSLEVQYDQYAQTFQLGIMIQTQHTLMVVSSEPEKTLVGLADSARTAPLWPV